MMPKNTICLWFDEDAEEAARFYAATFPDSQVTAVRRAPGGFPGGREGQVLTVELTVLGTPCILLNGGPMFKQTEAFSLRALTDAMAAGGDKAKRAFAAMMTMGKIDVAAIEAARRG